jgi:hypothetical protein
MTSEVPKFDSEQEHYLSADELFTLGKKALRTAFFGENVQSDEFLQEAYRLRSQAADQGVVERGHIESQSRIE